MIRLNNVTKEFNGVKVLDNININFRRHEFVCILGPSGSGKTTLLNIIAGNIKVPLNMVYLGNNDINNINLDYYHNYYLSYIYQNYNLIDNLNVYDNITLGLKLTDKKINRIKLDNIISRLGLEGLFKKNIKDLSGGEKQRVAIARSLVNNTKIILADEPTGALDSYNSIKVMNILKTLSLNKLIIMVTHNEELAKKYATRIIRIKDGHLINDSKPYYHYYNVKIFNNKLRLKLKDLLKISFNNLKNNLNRNILTIIAFSIGLLSLSLVLSISNGFNKELKQIEQNSLYNYPLIITKENISIDSSINKKTYKQGIININNSNIIKNNINNTLVNKVNKLTKLTSGISYYRNIDNDFKNISYVIPTSDYFKVIKGNLNKKPNEILLLLDNNNAIDQKVFDYLRLPNNNYDSVINKVIMVQKQKLTITGIVKSNNNYFSNLNGLLYSNNLFNNEIESIYIYPKNYQDKKIIKSRLKKYYLIDNAKSVIDITSNIIKGISFILIIFSLISLIVSIIMIGIISYIDVLERLKEIGIMKSLGARKKDIKHLFIIEKNILGLLSSLLAIILNIIISKILNNYINQKINFKHIIALDIKIIIFIILLGIILTYIAGIIPAKKASNKKITDILHNS